MNEPRNDLPHALALHRGGQLAAAIAAYQTVLASEPANAHLLYLLGTALLQSGQLTEGRESLARSLELQPANAPALNNLGIALKDLQRPEEALARFDQAIRLQPDDVDAHTNRGAVLKGLGRLDEAVQEFDQVIALRPDHAGAHNNRGNALQALERLDDALRSYDRAIALQPNYLDAHLHRARALRRLARPLESLVSLDHALRIAPARSDLHVERCVTLRELRRFDEAIASIDGALALKPDDAALLTYKGSLLGELKRVDEAVDCFERALARDPGQAAATRNEYGLALRGVGRHDEAIAQFDQAVRLAPESADARNNQGSMLFARGRLAEARACFERAIALDADVALSHSNLGAVLLAQNEIDAALASYERAIALDPADAAAPWYKAAVLLLRGDFEQGWALYERRLQKADFKDTYYRFPQLAWRGQQAIAGQRLLVHSEQGLGDVIQFCRYLPLVGLLGAEIVFEVPAPLVSLISTLRCEMTVIAKGQPRPAFDAYCPVMSLPFVFRTTPETIPARTPYLFADPAEVARRRAALGPRERVRVGLVWSGSTTHLNDLNRSLRLATLGPLLDLPVEWHSLQKEVRADDAAVLARDGRIRSHGDEIRDFSDTAALAECMDLVISVDTSVAHLAGAIGRPLWILLPHVPDYRWMLERADSPWYPTARLFRQPALGDWASVVDALRTSLLDFIEQAGVT